MWDDCINIYLYDEYGSPIGFLHRYTNMAEDTYNTYFFEKNMFGDIIAIYDQNGVKQVSYSYDAFGNSTQTIHVSGTRAWLNNLRYRGYYYDSETGFYYLNSRYYDPVTCRFINADSPYITTATPMSLTDKNLFAYCDNNPVMREDNGGYFWDIIFDVVSLVVSVVEVVKNPDDPMAWVGLAADVVSLAVPFATGGGAVVDAITKSDEAIDAAKTVRRVAGKTSDLKKATGSYEIVFESGKNYVGKGNFRRAIKSAEEKVSKYSDKVVSIEWKPSKNSREAFLDEYKRMKVRGVKNDTTYNKIWSPGRTYYMDVFSNLF